MSEMVIRGRKVMLRQKRVEDAWTDYTWRTDEELARLDNVAPLRMSFQEYLKMYQEGLRHPLSWSRRFAIDTLHGKHIGNCMCYDINTVDGEAEVGIIVGERAYWNKGYGHDSLVTLVDHLFTSLPLRRFYLHTLEWNNRARRCFDKVGFQEMGQVRRGGDEFILMELWRWQWEEARGGSGSDTQVAVHGSAG